jgi:hypothetical protein
MKESIMVCLGNLHKGLKAYSYLKILKEPDLSYIMKYISAFKYIDFIILYMLDIHVHATI